VKKGSISRIFISVGIVLSLTTSISTPIAHAITYGSTVSDPIASAPWVVSIWNSADNDIKDAEFICTGTLISPHTVLTAAHCTLQSGSYFVKVKSQALNDQTPFSTVSGVWTNPRYDPKNFTNDIGLMKLDDDFPGMTYPSLANAQAAKAINTKSIFTLYGWGRDQSGNLADLLRSSILGLQDIAATKYFKNTFNVKTMISAGRKIESEKVWSGACLGDSGGPLIISINQLNVIAGVTSFGEKSCLAPTPTIFSRVSYYLSDIQSGLKAVELKSSVVNRTAPVPITNPQLSGTLTANGTLTCDPGQWKNSVSTSVIWSSPKRLFGSTSSSVKVQGSDAGQLFSCAIIVSTKGGTIVRKVLSRQSASAPALISQPTISGLDLSAPVTPGAILRCDGWNWDSPVDNETIQWFLTSQANPVTPVNGQLVGFGRTLSLDSNIVNQLKSRFIACDVTGVRNGFNTDGVASIKLNPLDGPSITSVSIMGSSLAIGSTLSCAYSASQNSTEVDIAWGTSPDGINFNAFPGLTGNVLQISKNVLQLGAGKIVACQVRASNSAGQAQRVAVSTSPFPTPPAAPTVTISNTGTITANSYLSCSVQGGSGYYGQFTYQWGITNTAGSSTFIGAPLSSTTSLNMNSNYLVQAAGNYLTCVATSTNDAGSSSGFSSIFVPATVLPLPTPQAPTVLSEKADVSSVTESISIPFFSGFDSSKMSLNLSLSSPTGTCSSSNVISAIPTTISCSGLALTTKYTAVLSLSYLGSSSSGSTYSPQLTFTTGKSSIPTTPPSVLNYSQSYTGYPPVSPASATAAAIATTGLDVRFVAQDSLVPVSSTKAQLISSSGQVLSTGNGVFQVGTTQDGAWKVNLAISSTIPAGTYTVQAAASDGTNISGWVTLGNLTITPPTNLPGLTPTFGSVNSQSAGYTVQVSNYDPSYSWAASTSSGSASISSSGLITVTSLASGSSASVSVVTTKDGYLQGSGSITGSALTPAGLQIVPISSGLPSASSAIGSTVVVRYRATDGIGISNAWVQILNSAGSVFATYNSTLISGTNTDGTYESDISTILPQFSNGGTFSVEASIGGSNRRSPWVSLGTFNLTAPVALSAALVPTFGAVTGATQSGLTFQVTNYNSSFTWTVNTSAGAATISNSGLVSVTGLSPQQSVTVTVNTTQSGYVNGSSSKSGASTAAPVVVPLPTMSTSPQSYGAQTTGRNFSFTVGISGAVSVSATAVNGSTTLSAPYAQGPNGDNWIYATSGGSGGATGYTGSMSIPSNATPGTYSLTYTATNSAGATSTLSGGTFYIPTPVDPNAPTLISSQITSTNTSFNYGADSLGTQILLESHFSNAVSVSLAATMGTTTIIAGFNPGPNGNTFVYRWSALQQSDTTFRAALLFMAGHPKGTYSLTWTATNSSGASLNFSGGTYTLT
jgi:secreted trypsin-like serine protease